MTLLMESKRTVMRQHCTAAPWLFVHVGDVDGKRAYRPVHLAGAN